MSMIEIHPTKPPNKAFSPKVTDSLCFLAFPAALVINQYLLSVLCTYVATLRMCGLCDGFPHSTVLHNHFDLACREMSACSGPSPTLQHQTTSSSRYTTIPLLLFSGLGAGLNIEGYGPRARSLGEAKSAQPFEGWHSRRSVMWQTA